MTASALTHRHYLTVDYTGCEGRRTKVTFDSTSGGYNLYYRTTGGSGEKLNVLKRDTTSLKYFLEMQDGQLDHEFSAATTDAYRYARLEKIKDNHTNEERLSCWERESPDCAPNSIAFRTIQRGSVN